MTCRRKNRAKTMARCGRVVAGVIPPEYSVPPLCSKLIHCDLCPIYTCICITAYELIYYYVLQYTRSYAVAVEIIRDNGRENNNIIDVSIDSVTPQTRPP